MKFLVLLLVACAISACGTVSTSSASQTWDAYLEKKGKCPDSMPEGTVETQSYQGRTTDSAKRLSSPVMQATAEEKRVRSSHKIQCRVRRVKTEHGWVVVGQQVKAPVTEATSQSSVEATPVTEGDEYGGNNE